MIDSQDKANVKPRIMLVDDEPAILQTLSILLRLEGYDPVPVHDSGKAMQLLSSEKFAFMITDLRMMPVDGMELLRTAHEKVPDMPSILLTAYGSSEIRKQAAEFGVVAILGKPFIPEDIFSAIRNHIKRQ